MYSIFIIPVSDQGWKVDEALDFALQCLFREGKYFPADPFKCLLHVMRRQERAIAGNCHIYLVGTAACLLCVTPTRWLSLCLALY